MIIIWKVFTCSSTHRYRYFYQIHMGIETSISVLQILCLSDFIIDGDPDPTENKNRLQKKKRGQENQTSS